MPISTGCCTKNFHSMKSGDDFSPCYGDYGRDPDCSSHVITNSCDQALSMCKEHAIKHAIKQADKEVIPEYKNLWFELTEKLDSYIIRLTQE